MWILNVVLKYCKRLNQKNQTNETLMTMVEMKAFSNNDERQ